MRLGRDEASACSLAEEVVSGIQGAIVLARAQGEPALFERMMAGLRGR